jgi:hypothetical protein
VELNPKPGDGGADRLREEAEDPAAEPGNAAREEL